MVEIGEKRPDVDRVLSQLKDFQLRSVEKVFRRLYLDKDATNRFLIADEVGLGKTLVARGIIARGIDYIWDKVDRIDVIYICSNREIASQNINRLNITAEKQFSLAARMTLLPLKISGLKKRKMNFISFTPGTSFDLHSRTGLMLERALIYWILRDGWSLRGAGPRNVFQDWASRERWLEMVREFPKYYDIDDDLAGEFLNALENRIKEAKTKGKQDIRSRYDDLCQRFSVVKMHKNVPQQDRRDVARFVGELRMILAQACLEALEPDIVILDEFQRFKHLLDGKDEMSRLAQHLFNYKNKEFPTKIILLSATPYKMYTLHQEEAIDNHYEDFIRTVGFLFNSEDRTKRFEAKLKNFRNEFFAMSGSSLDDLNNTKQEIENGLRKVMIRTEKLAHTSDRNGMVKEQKDVFCRVRMQDLESFAIVDKLAKEMGTADMVEYWKSAPYLLNLMEDYDFKRKFKKALKDKQFNLTILKILKASRDKMLSGEAVRTYQKINPSNAKMRMLMENGIDQGSWKLLWVPPSLPYYKPLNAFKDGTLQDYTKSIIFSSWQVVPKAIAMLCSYEAERQMVTAVPGDQIDYEELRRKRSPLLVFKETEGRLAGMANLALMYPCLTLAQKIDPLELALEIMPKNGPPSFMRLHYSVREKVAELLDEAVGTSEKKGGRPDKRWYWAALALLDQKFYFDEVHNWLSEKDNGLKWENIIEVRGDGEADAFFRQHVRQFKEFFNKPEKLGPRPRDLVEILTKHALASPATCSLRSLLRLRKEGEAIGMSPVLQSASTMAAGFRVLYNLPESITLIRSLNEKEPYWERALEYGIYGNLQAVMDEYVHILKESLGFVDNPYEEIVQLIARAVYQAISIRTISLEFDEIEAAPYARRVTSQRRRIRCRYALRLGEDKSEGDEEVTRSDQVRAAFNSPFRPFLLATTSIGQEGLDFHQYCHSIYHWNLPANPVDLEQREGRIHRYKGLVIRRNLAKHFGLAKLKENKNKLDPWEFLFDQGIEIRDEDKDDIWPFWIFDTKGGAKINRHVPCLPLSRDSERLRDLKNTLVLYRMVFGQPRQEDLVEFLQKYLDKDTIEEIKNFRIDLSPR